MDKITLLKIFRLGLDKEKTRSKFYGKMKTICKKERVVQLFEALESWEKSHVEIFEKIEKKLFEKKEELADNLKVEEEYISALLWDHDHDNIEEIIQKQDSQCAIPIAMHSEKNSILFLEMIKEMIPDEYKETIDKILIEEKEHLNYLYKMQKELDNLAKKVEN